LSLSKIHAVSGGYAGRHRDQLVVAHRLVGPEGGGAADIDAFSEGLRYICHDGVVIGTFNCRVGHRGSAGRRTIYAGAVSGHGLPHEKGGVSPGLPGAISWADRNRPMLYFGFASS
jgi:hypothetical protein